MSTFNDTCILIDIDRFDYFAKPKYFKFVPKNELESTKILEDQFGKYTGLVIVKGLIKTEQFPFIGHYFKYQPLTWGEKYHITNPCTVYGNGKYLLIFEK